MSVNFPLAVSSWDYQELDAIQSVVDSSMFSMGPRVSEFESAFAEKFGAKHCVMVNSGSSANLLMIASLFFKKDSPLQRGDEVIVPAVSWSTTYAPLQQYGLHVKFVDVCPKTLNIDISKFEQAVSAKTKVVLLVNLLGNCNDFGQIASILDSKELSPYILEDNCESMGATLNKINAGTFGLMGTFSTFFSHHISTMEGGCILTDDDELHQILICIRAHGWTRNLPEDNLITGKKSNVSFDESFKFVLPGYNLRPLEMSGAIGLVQLKKLDELLEGRRENALYFCEKISGLSSVSVQKEVGSSSWFGFSLIVSDSARYERQDLLNALDLAGIEYRPIVTGNFLKNSQLLNYFDYEISGDVTGADLVERQGLFVGNHHFNLRNGIDLLTKTIMELEGTV